MCPSELNEGEQQAGISGDEDDGRLSGAGNFHRTSPGHPEPLAIRLNDSFYLPLTTPFTPRFLE